MTLRSVCRVKPWKNGFAVEYPNPGYAEYFKKVVTNEILQNDGFMEITVADPTESDNKAFMRIFHGLRDAFAREYNEPRTQVEKNLIQEFGVKEGLKRRLKADYGGRDVEGELKSLTEYTRGEWIVLIRGVITEALEQGLNVGSIAVEFGGKA
jgi:hypothetical protein